MKSLVALMLLFASTTIAQTIAINGVVKRADGSPAAGMHVALTHLPIENADDTSMETDNDETGHFSFAGVAPGKYTVSASSATTAAGWTDADVPSAGSVTVAITVGGDSRVLSGLLHGVSVGKAHVLVGRWGASGATVFSPLVRDGRYVIALPREGRYAVQAVAPGARSETVVLRPDETTRDLTLEKVFKEAPTDVVAWIAKSALPLKTLAAGSGFDDMAGIRSIVGNVRVVALGEATHGTHEFFQFKHRMLEYLVANAAFDVFAIEASFPDALAVNEFVLSGTGDAAQALAHMQFWTWNTQELLALIRWMRAWNENPEHLRKLRFYGFDMQNPAASVRLLRSYLDQHGAGDDKAFERIAPALNRNPQRPTDPEIQKNAMTALGELASKLEAAAPRDREWTLARQQVELIRQAVRFFGAEPSASGGIRDAAMAQNIQWILDHEPAGTKMVVWAHNGHVSSEPYPFAAGGTMGTHLRKMFGKDLVVFGAAFNRGSFQAATRGNPAVPVEHAVAPADSGTFDRTLADAGPPLFVLDLRAAKGTAREWLDSPLQTRSVGALYDDGNPKAFLMTIHPSRSFDAVFFVRDSTPSVPVAAGQRSPVQLPPAAATALNLDFARGTEGWTWPVATKTAYEVAATSEGCLVPPCVRLSRTAAAGPPAGAFFQRVDATPYRGKKIRFRVHVRSQLSGDASSARIWMRVDLPHNAVGFFDDMRNRPPKSLPEWTMLEIVGDVAPTAEALSFGGLFVGSGTAWYDEASLEVLPPE